MQWLDVFVHWLHLMAAIIWVGGTLFAAFVLTPIVREDLPPQVRYPLFKKIGQRFSRIGWAAITVLILTGAYKLSLVWSDTEIFKSTFGLMLSIKLTLILAMAVLSFLHDFVWGPRLSDQGGQMSPEEYRKIVSRLSFWARINVVLVIAIVFMGAMIRMNPF